LKITPEQKMSRDVTSIRTLRGFVYLVIAAHDCRSFILGCYIEHWFTGTTGKSVHVLSQVNTTLCDPVEQLAALSKHKFFLSEYLGSGLTD